MKINFIFSSITFLQYYIPIVIEANKRNIESIFYIKNNKKIYADPLSINNFEILKRYIKKFNIKTNFNLNELIKETGVIIMVDGDIYGPPKKYKKFSILFQLHPDSTKISLQEHMNFNWSYKNYIDNVSYSIFPNIAYAKLYNTISDKNIYLGNTKYDYILTEKDIYKKYKLKKQKYALVLFPKQKFIKNHNILPKHILNIYNYLYKLGYKIIVKSRPKDKIFTTCRGNLCVISDIFPNESLELMKISELCILFSSSAIEETIMMEIPTIDFLVDDEIEKRLNFLYVEKSIQQITNWKKLKYNTFLQTILKLAPKNSEIYKDLKKKYLFEGNISVKILDFINSI
tara:strand:+ start:404 stop:1435 length:1032 start_codon:yes stop_codon:yes gene_type:complete